MSWRGLAGPATTATDRSAAVVDGRRPACPPPIARATNRRTPRRCPLSWQSPTRVRRTASVPRPMPSDRSDGRCRGTSRTARSRPIARPSVSVRVARRPMPADHSVGRCAAPASRPAAADCSARSETERPPVSAFRRSPGGALSRAAPTRRLSIARQSTDRHQPPAAVDPSGTAVSRLSLHPEVSLGPVPVPGDVGTVLVPDLQAPQGVSGTFLRRFRSSTPDPQLLHRRWTVVPASPVVVHRVIHRAVPMAGGGCPACGRSVARHCQSSTYGQCRQPRPQHVPRSARKAAVSTNRPVAGSR